jgi:hypothetical protein
MVAVAEWQWLSEAAQMQEQVMQRWFCLHCVSCCTPLLAALAMCTGVGRSAKPVMGLAMAKPVMGLAMKPKPTCQGCQLLCGPFTLFV